MPYQCEPSSAEGGAETCNEKNFKYYAEEIETGKHFKKSCKLTSSHHDFRIIDALPEAVRNTTLLIVNLREPAARAVSHFHMLRRHGNADALNASVVDYFVRHPVGLSISRNRMTRVLGGEFCCKSGSKVSYVKSDLLTRALARLDQFCVVGLTDRVQDTMLYVQHALDLDGKDRRPKNLHYHNNAKSYQPVDDDVVKALREANAADLRLYEAGAERFAAQMKAIGVEGSEDGVGVGDGE
ncbi:hypothetical protein HYH03_002220 [Edaphochlamys debaryana]|uniref:Sulfotransferase n=1 Tax=Edaphochlamys debaryana TaxID=47281 RepID=A0A836C5F2_9CHLO|nr:hypothetical protein HYH03_002220 [Edaphochlamys debaryana]|eukprot:KAG2499933.1 hypothetical protein HYH03_002220 [Edaphochlamys debaryana]